MAITTVLSNLHITQRLRSLTMSSDQVSVELEKIKEVVRRDETRLSLITAGGHTHLYRLVNFYQLVSPWCDRSVELYHLERALAHIDYGQYNKARQALVAIAAQEERDPYGVNRTVPMQVPTSVTTFVSSPWTKSVEWWEQNRKILEKEPYVIGESCSPTVMEVVDAKAKRIVQEGKERWTSLFHALVNS